MEKKTDRRVLRTRKMLLEGLTDFFKEKDIKDISVKELVDDFNTMLDSCIESKPNPDPYPFMCTFFTYSTEHKETLSALLGKHGDLAFINYMKKIIQERMLFIWEKNAYRTDNFEYYSAFIISGCLGLVEKWVQNGFVESPEDMAELAAKMILQGIQVFS